MSFVILIASCIYYFVFILLFQLIDILGIIYIIDKLLLVLVALLV